MSISSSLAAGISGLNSHSQRLASISDNISNSSTFGYKRAVTDFHSMVTDSRGSGGYTAGGVAATSTRNIDQNGTIQRTDNSTDLAIEGRGFLPVSSFTGEYQPATAEMGLVSTGSFRPDNQGILRDANGNALLGIPANADGTFPDFARDTPASLRPVDVDHNKFAPNPTDSVVLDGLNLPASSAVAGGTGESEQLTINYFGNLGQSQQMTLQFQPTGDNTWTLTVPNPTGGNEFTFNLTFNTDSETGGTLNTVGGANEEMYENGVIGIPLGDDQTLNINIGPEVDGPGDPRDGISQLDTGFDPGKTQVNGSSVGNLLGVEVEPDGIAYATYESGFTRPIYQIPTVDVPNPNGLSAGDGQVYSVTRESGGMYLWDSGTGPVGQTLGYSRESSTVDVAEELTNLIQTQRSYSSNAKVIQTVDEMLQETTNLKR